MKSFKKNWIVAFLSAAAFLYGCNDTAPYYGEGIESEFNRNYSDRSSKNHVTGDLVLTYSGSALRGKEIGLALTSETTADLTFNVVFPGEAETVIREVTATPSADGYTLGGSYTTPAGTSFTLEGTVTKKDGKHVLDLSLENVTIPANSLSRKGKFPLSQFYMSSEEEIDENGKYFIEFDLNLLLKWKYLDENGITTDPLGQFFYFLNIIANNFVYILLSDLEFHNDGNITATYSPVPEDLDFMGILGGFTDADRGPKSVSPKNLITYFPDPANGIVYIRPDLTMILDLIASNSSTGDETDQEENEEGGEENEITGRSDEENDGGSGGFDISSIFDIINAVPEIQDWLNRGIPFRFATNDPVAPVYDYIEGFGDFGYFLFAGDYKLYLDTALFSAELNRALKSLAPMLLDLIGLDGLDLGGLGGLFEADFGSLISNTTEFNVGFYLHE